MEEYNLNFTIYDPWANPLTVEHEYRIGVTNKLPEMKADAIVMAVAHAEFDNIDVSLLLKDKHVIFDVKGILDKELVDGRL